MSNEDRNTQPPPPPDDESEPVDAESLPAGPIRDITARFDSFDERLDYVTRQGSDVLHAVHSLGASVAGMNRGLNSKLATVSTNIEIIRRDVIAVKQTQATQGNEIASIRTELQELHDKYAKLKRRVDGIAPDPDEEHAEAH